MCAFVTITPKMRKINQIMIKQCIGVNHCIISLGRNIIVEAPREYCADVVRVLKGHFEDVVDIRKAYLMIEDLHGYILVKPMVSEAPLVDIEGIPIPSAEKQFVDFCYDKEYAFLTEEERAVRMKEIYEANEMNQSKVMRYAGRKGKKDEMVEIITNIL